jgi:hypothetical protein
MRIVHKPPHREIRYPKTCLLVQDTKDLVTSIDGY